MKYVHSPTGEKGDAAILRLVFFEAMLNGYAAGAQKGTVAVLPGSKLVTYPEFSDWTVRDVYVVGPHGGSGGSTFIYHHESPVWMIQYRGAYEKEAVPCLKAALRAAYEKREFWGGRGLPVFPAPHQFFNGFRYTNDCCNPTGDWTGSWAYTRGREEVLNEDGKVRGWHEYEAMLL